MGGWVHRLINKDTESKTGECINCGFVQIRQTFGVWRCDLGRRLATGAKRGRSIYRQSFIYQKMRSCQKCAIKNEDIRFFDVNHKDSNHSNNDLSNLELLCPNCHRKETILLWNTWKKGNK